ncbi:MAG: NAD(P)H-dependent oxidoreductase subunit E [Paracoccaceae bacterium]|jgi:formate dehydrogenase subunit gamma|nr:NAD(P)H-dependent oxidoreductase subunit E [Paracoccaceae bacterium]
MPLDTSNEEIAAEARAIAERLRPLEGPLLPILHAVQERFGHVPDAALPAIADALNLTRAEVHGVASFYHDFRSEPAGRVTVRVCRSEACKSVGADGLLTGLEAALGVRAGETAPDGSVTLEPVYCLGLCACGPAAQVGDRLLGRATAERIAGEVN